MITRRFLLESFFPLISFVGYIWPPAKAEGDVSASTMAMRHNCSYLGSIRREMAFDIEHGRLPADVEKIVRCPLCSEQIMITAADAFDQIRFDAEPSS
ncbi:hypothetical protein AB4048_11100 [Rhizobium sp. RAF56]